MVNQFHHGHELVLDQLRMVFGSVFIEAEILLTPCPPHVAPKEAEEEALQRQRSEDQLRRQEGTMSSSAAIKPTAPTMPMPMMAFQRRK